MKKVLIITLEHPPQVGGIATYVHKFAEALPSDKVVVYAPPFAGAKAWDAKQSYKIIRKKPFFPRFIWPRWLRLFFQVRKIVRQEKIEVILLHHVLPVGYVGNLMKRFYDIPFLVFSHGTDVLLGTRTKWKQVNMRRVVDHAEQVIFNSESLKQRFLRMLPEYDKKALVVYPCPDKAFFAEPPDIAIANLRKQYALEGKQVILSVGRVADGKGYPHLIRMMPEIAKALPQVVWLIIGEGPKRNYLVEQIQKNNLQSAVRFIGEVPHEELTDFYHLADLFVLLTHPDEGKEEGLGLVFLEAAASGLAVVAGRSGGVEEAVVHAETGLIVDVHQDGDKKIMNTIISLMQNPEYRQELGDYAQQRIEAQFDWPSQIDRLDPWLEPKDDRGINFV